jgi:hypothetical protein
LILLWRRKTAGSKRRPPSTAKLDVVSIMLLFISIVMMMKLFPPLQHRSTMRWGSSVNVIPPSSTSRKVPLVVEDLPVALMAVRLDVAVAVEAVAVVVDMAVEMVEGQVRGTEGVVVVLLTMVTLRLHHLFLPEKLTHSQSAAKIVNNETPTHSTQPAPTLLVSLGSRSSSAFNAKTGGI